MTTDLKWFKSSYSGDEGGQCLEVAYGWRKSSHSDHNHAACVEVASHPTAIHVRDSKNADRGPHFTVTPGTWTAFLDSARR